MCQERVTLKVVEKNFYIKVVLSDLRPYRKNIIYGIFENECNRHICPYMGISMVYRYSGCDI